MKKTLTTTVQPADGSKKRCSIGARRNPESAAAVVKAARELLHERGYAGFSIDEVARRAGAGKPTIYRWWPTKADLFLSVYGAEKSDALPLADEGSLAEALTEYTLALWKFWRENPAGGAFCGLVAEAQASPAALAVLREKFLPERLERLHSLFAIAVARKEIVADEVDDRIAIWIGFNWFHLLTGQLDVASEAIKRCVLLITGTGKV